MSTAAKRQALKAPFPYFGGKRAVASVVWNRLGDVDNYVEPFAGSLAVLLMRPTAPRVETVNDADFYLANFWRATQRDPEAVAACADWPVNEADLHSRHRWLVLSDDAAAFRDKMRTDPDHYDPKIAGWWCWGICCWIGGGWCAHSNGPGRRPYIGNTHSGEGQGVHHSPPLDAALSQQVPRLAGAKFGDATAYGGVGIHQDSGRGGGPSAGERPWEWEQTPILSQPGGGIHAAPGLSQQVPNIDARGIHAAGLSETRPQGAGGSLNYGLGVHSKGGRPQLADAYDIGRGVNSHGELGTCAERRAWLLDWFGRLRDRLRTVRVCCGDWSRVCTSDSVTTRLGGTGVFLDPPYPIRRKCGKKSRAGNLYATDATGSKAPEQIRDEVLAWCREKGPDRLMRVCVAGYEGDGYESLEADGWSAVSWETQGGYGNQGAGGKSANARRERLWFSPACKTEATLFDRMEPADDV